MAQQTRAAIHKQAIDCRMPAALRQPASVAAVSLVFSSSFSPFPVSPSHAQATRAKASIGKQDLS